jgi:hypothetical protein
MSVRVSACETATPVWIPTCSGCQYLNKHFSLSICLHLILRSNHNEPLHISIIQENTTTRSSSTVLSYGLSVSYLLLGIPHAWWSGAHHNFFLKNNAHHKSQHSASTVVGTTHFICLCRESAPAKRVLSITVSHCFRKNFWFLVSAFAPSSFLVASLSASCQGRSSAKPTQTQLYPFHFRTISPVVH